MKLRENREGYQYVRLATGKRMRKRHVPVHRLVLEAFVGLRPKGKVARHLDGDSKNNRLSNLKWGTAKENAADAAKHGTALKGARHPNAKLTDAQVAQIRAAEEEPARVLSERYEVSIKTIYRVWNLEHYNH